MRKILFLSAALAFFNTHLFAQHMQWGLMGGMNFTEISGNGMKQTYNLGWQAGGFATFLLNSKWNIEPELLFSHTNTQKGDDFLTYYNNDGRYDADVHVKLDYLSLPVLAGYKINKYVSLQAGPQFSVLLYDDENLTKTNSGAFKKEDVGLVGGLQLNLETVRLMVRYNYGLSNINNIDDRYQWKNRQFQAGIGIRLH